MSDLAEILQTNTLAYIRTLGLFLVLSVALLFVERSISLIFLIISLILSITITVNYFNERDELLDLDISTKKAMDVLMFSMIGVILLICWIIYEVWNSSSKKSFKN